MSRTSGRKDAGIPFSKLFSDLAGCPPRYRDACIRNFTFQNFFRLQFFLYVLLALETYFLIVSVQGLLAGSRRQYYLAFLLLDLAFTLLIFITLVIYYRIRPNSPRETGRKHETTVTVFVFLALIWSTFVAVFEHVLSGEITTYMIAVLAIAVLYYSRSLVMILMCLCSFLILLGAMTYVGVPPAAFAEEYPSTLGLLVVSWAISRLLFTSFVRQFIARKRLLRMKNRLLTANRKLKETQVQLVHQEKLASIGQLAAGVAHEINNPISFLKSNVSALRQHLQALDPAIRAGSAGERQSAAGKIESPRAGEHGKEVRSVPGREPDSDLILQDIQELFVDSEEGFRRVTDIVQNLLSFSRSQTAGNMEYYDLHTGIESTLNVTKHEHASVAVIEREYGSIPLIQCYPGEINQVLLNIITNAVHALRLRNSGRGGRIAIRTMQEGEHVICRIANNGPAIPPGNLKRIFEPFFTTKPAGEGTGLGLSIAHDIIVKRHGGELNVESYDDRTAFTIRLRVTRNSEVQDDQKPDYPHSRMRV